MEEKLNELTFQNAAIFGVLIAVAYWVVFYHPSDPKVRLDSLAEEIVEAEGAIARLNKEIKLGQEMNKEIQVMEQKAKKVYSQLQEEISADEASSTISEEARSLGLSIQSMEASGEWVKLKTVAVVDIEAVVAGSFGQIMVFLSELTRNNKVYSVGNLDIAASDEDGGGTAAAGASEVLSLTARIQAYRKLSVTEIATMEEEENEI